MTTSVAQNSVQVYLGSRSYDVFIITDFLASLGAGIEPWFEDRADMPPGRRQAMIVTDQNVVDPHANNVRKSLEANGWQCGLHVMEAGEQSKCLETVSEIYDELVEMKAGRQVVILAVGGGVVGDAAGFVASTYTRGVPVIQVPTTLLAQVDSSIGGKVGINHKKGKNLIGQFHQPLGVVIDTATLNTLPDREYRAGLAEVVKYGVILDDEMFAYLEKSVDGLNNRDMDVLREVIRRSCRHKADVVEEDEFETTGRRAILNYGHTFAHAYEALTQYGALLHGEAVSIGMIHASQLAERLGMVDSTVTERQQKLLNALSLPTELPESVEFTADDVLDRMKLDKKNVSGKLRFVLPTRIGEVRVVTDVNPDDVRAVLPV
ncbi:3-dehydroquinate synthase [Thalassoroseus pseudoceratinae]|uniref:3-dehydroquinate synthase n=1 Tax=Thalassoroseus pseudoceratinae TaxID=2713176 RepID=UPI00197CC0C8|nr:3-dehydroquinate synthase [Thalassoroseus pseudoceratinae]